MRQQDETEPANTAAMQAQKLLISHFEAGDRGSLGIPDPKPSVKPQNRWQMPMKAKCDSLRLSKDPAHSKRLEPELPTLMMARLRRRGCVT